MTTSNLPAFPYGAVYFRKSNPPQADWARDYGVAAEDGMNIFRHWFLWSAIEIEPGRFDWADYDRQFDLAAANGCKTIIAEFSMAAPEWAFRRYAHARYETVEGRPVESQMSASCATASSWPLPPCPRLAAISAGQRLRPHALESESDPQPRHQKCHHRPRHCRQPHPHGQWGRR